MPEIWKKASVAEGVRDSVLTPGGEQPAPQSCQHGPQPARGSSSLAFALSQNLDVKNKMVNIVKCISFIG